MAPLISPADLTTRALFGSAENTTIQCPKPLSGEHGDPLFGPGSITLRQLMVYVSAPCLFFTVISCWFLSWRHLHRYTSPQEQRQILRIINLPIAYSLFNLLALAFVMDYQYIEPIGSIYEAFTVAALFLLVLEWVVPDGMDRERYFDNLELRNRRGQVQPGGSLKWFQRSWQAVLLYPLLKTIIVTIQIVTQYYHVFCESSWSPKDAHLWLTIIDYLFVGGALGATIRFYRRLRRECAPIHRPAAKIYSFIGILVFQIIQDLIFHILNGKLFSPTLTATYNDINFGIASFMTCCEALIFSLIFQWSYSSSEYKQGEKLDRLGKGPVQRQKTFRAILDALNLADIVNGMVVGFELLFTRVQSRYGAARGPQRDQTHLEPLTDRRGLVQESDDYTQYNSGYSPPPMPPPAR